MNCERNRRLLYLYRDGELTVRQTKKMERHLHTCNACRREKNRIESAARKISLAGETVPGLADPVLLTRAIMEKIEDEAYGNTADFRESCKMDVFLQRLTTPGLRWAAVGTVLLIVGTFIFQGMMLLHRITVLEEKMAQRSNFVIPDTQSTAGPRAELALILDKMEDIYEGIPEDKEWVIIDKGTLRQLMTFYLHWRDKEGKLLHQMRDEIPLLETVEAFKKLPGRRVSREELKKILARKDTILKNLKEFKHWRTL
jgi:hypothetical protein